MRDLVAFLNARLREDEAAARPAGPVHGAAMRQAAGVKCCPPRASARTQPTRSNIARHNPRGHPALNIDGDPSDGAQVADITGCVNLAAWPEGSRLIVRRERPHPGAQLGFTDTSGHRFTAFLTDAKGGQLASL